MRKIKRIIVMMVLVLAAGGIFSRCNVSKDRAVKDNSFVRQSVRDENFSYLLQLLDEYF